MKTIVVFCHRFFELRFMIVSRLLDHLAKKARLVIMMPADMIDSFAPFLPESTTIVPAHYPRRGSVRSLRQSVSSFIDGVLYFTFAHTDRLPNATAAFHRTHHLTWAASKSWPTRLVARLKVLFSQVCSRSSAARRLLQRLYFALATKERHRKKLMALEPDLMVGCSFGMGLADASFLAEARAMAVPSAVIVQSWDRTSNKGYPTLHPDYAIVWNEIMRRECIVNLEFDDDKVFVEGAPSWDRHFTREALIPEPEWRRRLEIAPDHKVIFYACGGYGSHPANLEIIPQVLSLAHQQPFATPIHVVFRLYPQYYAPDSEEGDAKRKRDEIEALLAGFDAVPGISITRPEVVFDGKNFMPGENDQTFMLSCLANCDVSLSQVSSQMIEASIFDKPAINIAYGKRRTQMYDISIGDYLTEHLLRVYRTGAIYQVGDFEELRRQLADTLRRPQALADERRRLVQQEAPIHRGSAAKAVVNRLCQLASGKVETAQDLVRGNSVTLG